MQIRMILLSKIKLILKVCHLKYDSRCPNYFFGGLIELKYVELYIIMSLIYIFVYPKCMEIWVDLWSTMSLNSKVCILKLYTHSQKLVFVFLLKLKFFGFNFTVSLIFIFVVKCMRVWFLYTLGVAIFIFLNYKVQRIYDCVFATTSSNSWLYLENLTYPTL